MRWCNRWRYSWHGDIFHSSVWSMICAPTHAHPLNVRVCVCFRSFTTIRGALTPACHVTATRWAPSRGHVTQRQASVSAGLAWLVASATHVTTPSLRSQTLAVKVRMLVFLCCVHVTFGLYVSLCCVFLNNSGSLNRWLHQLSTNSSPCSALHLGHTTDRISKKTWEMKHDTANLSKITLICLVWVTEMKC